MTVDVWIPSLGIPAGINERCPMVDAAADTKSASTDLIVGRLIPVAAE
jgi:hypothetical protein